LSTPAHDSDTAGAPVVPDCRPMRADARRNRDRILAAAASAFSTYGTDAQMDDVARAARVGVGTVYRHFPTKEALISELVRRKFERFIANARAGLEEADPWEAFAGVLRANAAVMAQDAAVQQIILRTPESWTFAAAERDELRAIGAQLVRRAQEDGALRADVTVDDIPMIMCGVSSTMAAGGPFDWRRHLELILDGLRAR
jgi:AcrR family transcriptional regulator